MPASAIKGVVFTMTLRIIHLLNELLLVIILENADAIRSQISDKRVLCHICNLGTITQ